MTVITVKVSNEERALKEKHLIDKSDDEYKGNAALEKLVREAVENFNAPVDDVTVIINIPW